MGGAGACRAGWLWAASSTGSTGIAGGRLALRRPTPGGLTHHPRHAPLLSSQQFVARYGGKKVERARDLFRQVRFDGCVQGVPCIQSRMPLCCGPAWPRCPTSSSPPCVLAPAVSQHPTHPPIICPPSPPAQAIDEAPAAASKPLFLAYAKYEEEHGLARNAMQVGARQGAGHGVRLLLDLDC